MKNLLLACLLACATPVVAQKNLLNIDSLIKSKSFTVVVNKATPKPGYVNRTNTDLEIPSVNPMISLETRQTISSITPVGNEGRLPMISSMLAKDDAKFATTFQTVSSGENDNAIYYIQDKEKLILSDQTLPKSISGIINSDLITVSSEKYILNSKKQKNGNWELEYSLNRGERDYPFAVTVTPEGKLILNLRSGIFYGFIMPNNIVKDKI